MGAKPGYIWDDRLKGFALRVLANGESSYYVKYRAPGGKVRWHRIGPTSLLNAQQARGRAEEIIAQAKLGRDIIGESQAAKDQPTVAELAARHQEVHRPPDISQGSFENYESLWRLHIVPTLGTKKVADLTARDVIHLRDSRKTLSMGNIAVRCLSKALNDCEKWGWRPKGSNPVSEVRRHKIPHRDRILTRDELRQFFSAMNELKKTELRKDYFALFTLLLLTGLRLRELLNAEWEQVVWDFKVLKLRKTKNNQQRAAQLGDDGIEILRGLRREQGPKPSRWIFPGENGPVKYPHHYWTKILEHAGIENFRIHDLRHTAASYAHQLAGFNIRDVQDMLGHKNAKTTGIYLNLSDEMRAAAAERRNNAMLALATSDPVTPDPTSRQPQPVSGSKR